MRYKCLNPGCRHEWDTRGDYAKIIRCPSCRKGYVLDWDTFQAVVLAEANWLIDPIGYMALHLKGHAKVKASSFPCFLSTPSGSSTWKQRRQSKESNSPKSPKKKGDKNERIHSAEV